MTRGIAELDAAARPPSRCARSPRARAARGRRRGRGPRCSTPGVAHGSSGEARSLRFAGRPSARRGWRLLRARRRRSRSAPPRGRAARACARGAARSSFFVGARAGLAQALRAFEVAPRLRERGLGQRGARPGDAPRVLGGLEVRLGGGAVARGRAATARCAPPRRPTATVSPSSSSMRSRRPVAGDATTKRWRTRVSPSSSTRELERTARDGRRSRPARRPDAVAHQASATKPSAAASAASRRRDGAMPTPASSARRRGRGGRGASGRSRWRRPRPRSRPPPRRRGSGS